MAKALPSQGREWVQTLARELDPICCREMKPGAARHPEKCSSGLVADAEPWRFPLSLFALCGKFTPWKDLPL